MSFITRWFRKAESDNYEEILSALAADIQTRRNRLSDIRLRQRRSTLLVTTYTLAFWVLYLSLWYTRWLPSLTGLPGNNGWEKAVKVIPVLIGPVLIVFTRQIVDYWYTRKGDHEEQTLRELLKQQRKKVDEIKAKTNYNATRNLLERYGDGGRTSPGPSARRTGPASGPAPGQGNVPATPQLPGSMRTPQRNQNANPQSFKSPMTPESISMRAVAPPPPLTPAAPRQKQWYDRLADALLGDDDSVSASSPNSQYALICEKCFKHNGLVKESMWESAQYVCPQCGHFNRSKLQKRRNSGSSTSASTAPAPSTPSRPTKNHVSNSISTRSSDVGPQSPLAASPMNAPTDGEEMDVDNSDESSS